jgi:hypothetical protein
MNSNVSQPVKAAGRVLSVVLAAGVIAGCEVTNPGPVQDEFLDQSTAHQAVVNGSGRMLSRAVSLLEYTGALAAREILPGGQTGAAGHDPIVQAGVLPTNLNNHWAQAQQSRWIAEDAIRRFTALPAGQVNQQILTQAYVYAGYANNVLGENFCDAVFDGGPKQPSSKYFERAVQAFTNAIAKAPAGAVGDSLKTAAYAGRAQAKLYLKDYAGAAQDAALVPITYKFTVARATEDVATGGNDVYYANANSPYRGYTIWKTWFESYYDQTGDPRTPYAKDAKFPLAQQQLSGYGPVPWEYQTKYKTGTDPHRLATGREMLLIRAEAALQANDIGTAMNLINQLRAGLKSDKTGAALPTVTAANLTDAWTILKRERRIELWLEAKALGDIRRWKENGTPGTLDWPDFESVSTLFKQNTPSTCFATPDDEINTNPNF